ncbi:hypothetical protein LOTGIDRAFT_232253 [Lottia gigantea]|uniref:Uncharacterized protein n=1 Tax=Lottia gigantea TaxID=225164 RepID=V4AD70_LOTGI|nr:hypothetical protein LOTGIDRAFT_232253 [Lottia gigantea]ESO94802.1 hypothetical protein LOTGIDRAFT_232253 [Lottia gigantea]
MASLNLKPNVQSNPNFGGFEIAQSWGENKLSDNEPLGSKDPFFQRYRNNFRNYHVLEGYGQKQDEDYGIPRPLSNNFFGRISSLHNTNRRIRRPSNFQVFPWNDYQRTSDIGNHSLCDTTREALDGKDRDLHRTSRYLTIFPDHSSQVIPVSGRVPPQHYHHKGINKILKRCHLHDYHILLPPLTHAESSPSIYESRVIANSMPTEKQSSAFIKKIKNLRGYEDAEPVGNIGIAQKRCKQIKYPSRSGKIGQCVRFNVPEAKEPPEKPTETIPPKAPSYLSCSRLGPENWQTLDREVRRAIYHKESDNYKEYMVVRDGDEDVESNLDKEMDLNNEEDDIEKVKCEKEIVEETTLSCITNPFAFKLIHQRGKFVSPWNNNIDPKYMCSKSDASKRFHNMFPDIVPDQRDNYTYGKKVSFYGYNSSAFR